MAQRGNRPKYVAGAEADGQAQPSPDEPVEADPNVVRTAGGGGMGKTSPRHRAHGDRKAAARSTREAEREQTAEADAEVRKDDFRTVTVPGPGPRDAEAGRATTRQLETHDLRVTDKQPRPR
jgi:hypothetical protein